MMNYRLTGLANGLITFLLIQTACAPLLKESLVVGELTEFEWPVALVYFSSGINRYIPPSVAALSAATSGASLHAPDCLAIRGQPTFRALALGYVSEGKQVEGIQVIAHGKIQAAATCTKRQEEVQAHLPGLGIVAAMLGAYLEPQPDKTASEKAGATTYVKKVRVYKSKWEQTVGW